VLANEGVFRWQKTATQRAPVTVALITLAAEDDQTLRATRVNRIARLMSRPDLQITSRRDLRIRRVRRSRERSGFSDALVGALA
jgi:hypothetical protein